MTRMMKQDIRVYEKSNIYDFDNSIMMHYYPNRILQLTNQKESCLELGIGHGYATEIFSEHFRNHTVLDGDRDIICSFRERFPHTRVIETYFETWETKETFALIIMGFVLEHVESPQVILNKYKRMLKENGRIFIAVPNAEALNRRVGKEAGMLPDLELLSENDIRLGHRRYYTLKSIVKECETAGLKVVRQEGIYLKPLTTKQMLELKLTEEIIQGFLAVGREYPELSLGILLEAVREDLS